MQGLTAAPPGEPVLPGQQGLPPPWPQPRAALRLSLRLYSGVLRRLIRPLGTTLPTGEAEALAQEGVVEATDCQGQQVGGEGAQEAVGELEATAAI
jgi:hypothetical protein